MRKGWINSKESCQKIHGEEMYNYRLLILIIFLSSLIGCASTKTVEIPIPVSCPTPHIPPKPHLQSAKLNGTESPDVIEKAQVADIQTLINYSNRLIAILKGYSQ